ncbi:carbohydrate ABC transporter substrate-binding protein (CUT1 family) [Nonomuraea fuscirosea]|uniref:Carbohydrate ABC transporter substrate-binding protein (CUT1 family) n=1 Tax=Nonomuraea fuscirosea TaxID=1291556 RepID=A0A2T0M7Q6_9ACTN|nr:sugar ABC transporter substrate-binding protein [Nonomuraea fuscirosea]PRX53538.1 carbohydrate ABC transporter substrate-binding protein (CUT1 family) [Nonomuraea fuscirosea]
MRITMAAAGLAGLLVLTACGSGAEPAATGPATLRMTIWTGNAEHLSLLNSIADEYKKTHQDVAAIKFDTLPIENYTTTLTTQIAGGNAPDLAWILENSAPDFVGSGALAPLDNLVQPEQLAPATTKLWQQEGKLYAYPFSTSPFGVFVNLDLLKQAGQKPPKAGWTWEQAVAAAAAVNKESGKAGLVVRDFDYKGWDNLATVWGGWGAEAWSEDGKTCGFAKPEMVEAMTFLHKAIFTDKALPAPGTTADFFAGEAGMTITQISRASLLKDATFKWDLIPLPTGPKGAYSVIGQAGIGVIKKSPNAAKAADFLSFLSNPDNSAKLGQYFPPPRTQLLTAESLGKSNPLLKPEQLQQVVIDGISTGRVKPSHAGQAELAQTVRAQLDQLWQPGADVTKTLAGVCTAIQPMLAK